MWKEIVLVQPGTVSGVGGDGDGDDDGGELMTSSACSSSIKFCSIPHFWL